MSIETQHVLEDKALSSLINNEYKDYAMYILENRAIPCYVDGLKASQKKLLYTMIHYYKGKKVKNSEFGASISSVANYHHGNASPEKTIVVMGADWNNHAPLFQQHGNFGSRLINTPASSRYIFSSLSENYKKYFCDEVVCNKNIDQDNPEPQQYLPIIPFVLVNGVEGIAIGFACKYLPHHPSEVAKACIEELNGTLDNDYVIPVSFPHYKGNIVQDGKKVTTQGIVTQGKKKNTWDISEVAWGTDREKIFKFLSDMIDKNLIEDFDDQCDDNGFSFLIKLNKDQNDSCLKNPIDYFKLESSFTENYSALDEKGQLIVFDSKLDIIRRFVSFRLEKVKERIDYDIKNLSDKLNWLTIKYTFIQDIVDKNINVVSVKKDILVDLCMKRYSIDKDTVNKLISIAIYDMTQEQVDYLKANIVELEKCILKLKKSNPKKVYMDMLKKVI